MKPYITILKYTIPAATWTLMWLGGMSYWTIPGCIYLVLRAMYLDAMASDL